MLPLYGLLILAYHVATGSSTPATYDQRQTGDLNVQIHVKDLQVVALVDSELLDDYTDYDYFYDYAEFTIKPIGKPPTGSTTTVKPWTTWPTNPPSSSASTDDDELPSQDSTTSKTNEESPNSTESDDGKDVTASPNISGGTTTESLAKESSTVRNTATNSTAKLRINDKKGSLFGEKDIIESVHDNLESSTSSLKASQEQRARKRCRSGYSPDGKGRCRRANRRRVSLIPFAVQLTPKFLEGTRHKTSAAA